MWYKQRGRVDNFGLLDLQRDRPRIVVLPRHRIEKSREIDFRKEMRKFHLRILLLRGGCKTRLQIQFEVLGWINQREQGESQKDRRRM